MTWAGTRFGRGTRLVIDGEAAEITELMATQAGNEVILKDGQGRIRRMSQRELLTSDRVRVIPDGDGPSSGDRQETAAVVLGRLTPAERARVAERVAHVEEALTGYRSGSPEIAAPGEPRLEYDPALPLTSRYAAKAAELSVTPRTIARWVRAYRNEGPAGLASVDVQGKGPLGRADPRWVEMAVEVMKDNVDESGLTKGFIADAITERIEKHYGPGVVPVPSRTSAYRFLDELDHQVPLFSGSSKRRRDVADRPKRAHGRLRPVRPGEYLLMDTTRSDVFALNPRTMRWVQAEITVGMDWYTRCITGLRVTPVSTKAVDASATLYQAFRPARQAGTGPPTPPGPTTAFPATS